ncbi:MAG: inorganic diphosphatase [Helicobacter sp.]|nr:inorganic diphosphatase [Helicobacter sp.]
MNLDKIPAIDKNGNINAVIEIPYLSNVKYELDKDLGAILADRVLFGANFYPANYGFVPNTLSDDGDPIDVLVLSEYALIPGSVIKVRLIGVLRMIDGGENDEKLLAVPISKVDPRFEKIQNYDDLPQITLDKIKDFFTNYKNLEKKEVKVLDFECKDAAKIALDLAIKNCK